MKDEITERDRILGALWGAVVGDALGVPVEFQSRDVLRAKPVTGLRGFGTHDQPPGTWSDDSSLMICTVESLLDGYDLMDMGRRFLRWFRDGHWCPHGEVFDIGGTTHEALLRIERGVSVSAAGGMGEASNGNGSLMRMLPIPLWFGSRGLADLLERTHEVSCVTHGHPRSKMVCGLFSLFVRELLRGVSITEAYETAADLALNYYGEAQWHAELRELRGLFGGEVSSRGEDEIDSGGYVVETMEASIWCLLRGATFAETVSTAVNLGGDTDTTGSVAGALAGVHYGYHGIPEEWVNGLARHDDLAAIFESAWQAIERTRNGNDSVLSN